MMPLPRIVFSLTKKSVSRHNRSAFRHLSSLDVSEVVPVEKPVVKMMTKREKKDVIVSVEPQNIHTAIMKMRELAWAKFDETVEIAVNLGVDPRKPNQSVKGVAKLPHGTGKKVRVAVFAQGSDASDALAAGADIVGGLDLVALIQKGELNFDRVIATPEMMPIVTKIGRILGPRGMMPNPRMGTVTKDVAKAIQSAKQGAVQFRVEKGGIIQVGVGKLSFPDSDLLNNIRSFMVAVSDSKPEGLKAKYILKVSISSTMGHGLNIITQNVDPSSAKFMLDPSKMGIMK